MFSILHHLNSVFHRSHRTVHGATIERQADLCKEYLDEYLDEGTPLFDVMGRKRLTGRTRRYKTRSTIRFLPGTLKSFSGPKGQTVVIDEADAMEWRNIQQALGMLHSEPDMESMLIFGSTRERPYGAMQRLVDKSLRPAGGEDIVVHPWIWCIFEVMQPCRTRSKACPLWERCEHGALCQNELGFVPVSDVIQKAALADDEIWDTQYRCCPWEQRVTTNEGDIEIGRIVDARLPVKVKSLDLMTGRAVWKPVTGWFYNGPHEGEWLRVHTSPRTTHPRSRQTVTTPDHLWILADGSKCRADELREGDQVLLESPVLTPRQEQIVRGMLLGDGHIRGGRQPNALSFAQHVDSPLTDWLKEALAPLLFSQDRRYKNTRFIETATWPVFARWRQVFYRHPLRGHKCTPLKEVAQADELALAIWYLSDGDTAQRPGDLFLSLGVRATLDEAAVIAECLRQRWGLDAVARRVRARESGIALRRASWEILTSLVAPYLELGLGRKLWVAKPELGEGYEGAVTVRVAKIERFVPPRADRRRRRDVGRYDIEVADTHTFFAGGVLISICKRPARHGLVYDTFDESVHINDQLAEYRPLYPVEISCDWGYGDPAAVLFFQRDRGRRWQFDEIYGSRMSLPTLWGKVLEVRQRYGGFPIMQGWGDPEGAQENLFFRAQLRQLCGGRFLSSYPSLEPHQRAAGLVKERIKAVRLELRDGQHRPCFHIHSRCRWTIAEFKTYHLGERGEDLEGRMIYDDTPVDQDNHAMDSIARYVWATRYRAGVMASIAEIHPTQRTPASGPPMRPMTARW
jgi:hypothetical protein